jgi:uncharacterized protein YcfL
MNAAMNTQRRLASFASVTITALLLAGCGSTGTNVFATGPRIAEVEAPDASFSENIASLSDVVKRNPESAEAYNTRGAA